MKRLLVFGGTSEARLLVELLSRFDIMLSVCVATEYGREMLSHIGNIRVIVSRLDSQQMILLIKDGGYDTVVDATHPFAVEVTANIADACKKTGIRNLRLLREDTKSGQEGDITLFPDLKSAVSYLNTTSGNILITTGSKELSEFCSLVDYKERCYARVLPAVNVLEHCKGIGFSDGHIIAMQGPFCEEINFAMLKQYNCKYLVTKNTGSAGGIDEKISAAQRNFASVILIGRPTIEKGYSVEQTAKLICEEYGLSEPAVKPEAIIKKKEYFPFFLPSTGKRVLFVGGGKIASRRIASMLKFNFQITVIAPALCDTLLELSRLSEIEHISKEIDPKDLEDFDYIIAATNQRDVNHMIAEAANRLLIPVNIVDKKEECGFYFPGIVLKEEAVIGVSCDGASHRKAKEISERIRGL